MTIAELIHYPLEAIVRSPESLTETNRIARLLWLRSLFGEPVNKPGQEPASLRQLAGQMTEMFIPAGAKLYEQGGVADALYFVVEGEIRHGSFAYSRYGPGDVLGFVDTMCERPHLFDAQVEADAVVLCLRFENWLAFLEEHPVSLRALVSTSARNIIPRPDSWAQSPEAVRALSLAEQQANPMTQFVRRLLALRCCPVFRTAGIQALAQLIQGAQIVELAAGETFDAPALGIWAVTRGAVRLRAARGGAEIEEHDYTPGTLLGSMALLYEIPSIFEAQVMQATELVHISSAAYIEVMEDHFDVARSSLAYFARKAEEANAESSENISRVRA